MAAQRKTPAVAGRGLDHAERLGALYRPVNLTTGRPLDHLLARLENVRQYGKGWRADCPCGHKSRGALSIAEADSGAVLLRCWAGCEAAEVLAAIGVSLADLFPERIAPTTPEQRRERRQRATEADWRAALGVLDVESLIALIAAQATARGDVLSSNDRERLTVACERIAECRASLAPAPKWRPTHV